MGGEGFETHVFTGEDLIAKPPHVVFQVLTDVENALNAYSPTTLSVHPVTDSNFGVGAQWRLTRRELFLRQEQLFTVLECKENEKLVFLMDDMYNVAKYTFLLHPDASGGTRVSFAVDCYMRLSPDATSASVKLARMMEKNDGALVQRLKTYVESVPDIQPAVSVF
eukprot:jgi/Botrbrau1/12784/Bobra.117_1s0003.1